MTKPEQEVLPPESVDELHHFMRQRDLGDLLRGVIKDWQAANNASDDEVTQRLAGVLARQIADDPHPLRRASFLLRMQREFPHSVETIAAQNFRKAKVAGVG